VASELETSDKKEEIEEFASSSRIRNGSGSSSRIGGRESHREGGQGERRRKRRSEVGVLFKALEVACYSLENSDIQESGSSNIPRQTQEVAVDDEREWKRSLLLLLQVRIIYTFPI